MFAPRVWDAILHSRVRVGDFRWAGHYFVTQDQHACIGRLASQSTRLDLWATFARLDLAGTPAHAAVREINQGPGDKVCVADRLLSQLSHSPHPGRQWLNENVVIAEIAIQNAFYLVTDDEALAKVVHSLGGHTSSLRDFLTPADSPAFAAHPDTRESGDAQLSQH